MTYLKPGGMYTESGKINKGYLWSRAKDSRAHMDATLAHIDATLAHMDATLAYSYATLAHMQ